VAARERWRREIRGEREMWAVGGDAEIGIRVRSM
jgi:hypothetical protein